MLCIGAAIPAQNACGFVQPVFVQNEESNGENRQLWFCKTDKNRKITGFIPNKGKYLILNNDDPDASETTFNKGSYAPIAFYCSAEKKQKLFIGKYDQMRSNLLEVVRVPSFPIEARFKAAQFLHKTASKETGLSETLLVNNTYLQYYQYLRQMNKEYAIDWQNSIKLTDEVDVSKLLLQENDLQKSRRRYGRMIAAAAPSKNSVKVAAAKKPAAYRMCSKSMPAMENRIAFTDAPNSGGVRLIKEKAFCDPAKQPVEAEIDSEKTRKQIMVWKNDNAGITESFRIPHKKGGSSKR